VFASEAGRNRTLFERVEDSVSAVSSESIIFALYKLEARQWGNTHGGLKNCSSDTYMPRNISKSKKYFPARSNEPSPSSHRFGRGNRKPGGGGPAGVAARRKVVEKKATVAGEGRRPDANCDDLRRVAAEEPRASIINGFVLAIVGAESEQGGCVVLAVAK
jgi:hypothetical protein